MDCRVEPWCENCRGGETKPAKEGDGAAGAVLVYCSGAAGVVLQVFCCMCSAAGVLLHVCCCRCSAAGVVLQV